MSFNESPRSTPASTIRTRSRARMDEQLGGTRTLRSSSKLRGQDSSDAESSPSTASGKVRKARSPEKPNGREVSSLPKESYSSSKKSDFYVLVPPRSLFTSRITTGHSYSHSSDDSFYESKLDSPHSPCKPHDQAVITRSTSYTIASRAPIFLAFMLIMAALWRAYGEDLWRTYGHYLSY